MFNWVESLTPTKSALIITHISLLVKQLPRRIFTFREPGFQELSISRPWNAGAIQAAAIDSIGLHDLPPSIKYSISASGATRMNVHLPRLG
jgi:hypothetical protein